MDNIEDIISNATVTDKLSLLAGKDFYHTNSLSRFGIPSVRVSDGPNGIRGTRFFNSVPTACIPCGSALGATWNRSLVYESGVLLGKECLAKGAHAWLGPTVNIQRSPLGGRGFESYSEDPFLSGTLAACSINGLQSRGPMATLKHLVANDQEEERHSVDSIVSQRALREIYLMPFQLAVKLSNPAAIMTSYNKLNGIHCSENPKLLQDIVKKEWGYTGLIMSDWHGTYSSKDSILAGLDLEMPGPGYFRGVTAKEMIANGKMQARALDPPVRSVLKWVKRASAIDVAKEEGTRNLPQDRALNRRLVGEGVVLLKNSGGVLPLEDDGQDIAIIGPNATEPALFGGGSAALEPYYSTNAIQGLRNTLKHGTKIHHEIGVHAHTMLPALSGDFVRQSDGKPGVSMKVFDKKWTVADRKLLDEYDLEKTEFQLMDYSVPDLDVFYVTLTTTFVVPETGLYDFGLTVFGTADLFINDELVLDNSTVQRQGDNFFGRGTEEERITYEFQQDTVYHLRVEFGSSATAKIEGRSTIPFAGGACRLGGCLQLSQEVGIARAVALAKRCKKVILVVGLNKDWETEGRDRTSMDLPPGVPNLVEAILAVAPTTIVVTQSGTPVSMPWASSASTLLHTWYGGSEYGNGLADVIFGRQNPSGKLPITFPKRVEDGPSYLCFGSDNGRVIYGEDVFVGYRGYEARCGDVEFGFGHGLSYTTFSIRDLELTSRSVQLLISNTGKRDGAEVLQLFVSPPMLTAESKLRIRRPKRELKGYDKVFLKVGEEKKVVLEIDELATACWDEQMDSWVSQEGMYIVTVVAGPLSLSDTLTVERTTWWNGL